MKVNCLNVIFAEEDTDLEYYEKYSIDDLDMLVNRGVNVALIFYKTKAPVLIALPEDVSIEKEFGDYKMNEIRDICALHKKCDKCSFKGFECGFANIMSTDFDTIVSTKKEKENEDEDN